MRNGDRTFAADECFACGLFKITRAPESFEVVVDLPVLQLNEFVRIVTALLAAENVDAARNNPKRMR